MNMVNQNLMKYPNSNIKLLGSTVAIVKANIKGIIYGKRLHQCKSINGQSTFKEMWVPFIAP